MIPQHRFLTILAAKILVVKLDPGDVTTCDRSDENLSGVGLTLRRWLRRIVDLSVHLDAAQKNGEGCYYYLCFH